jgi:cytochrome c553
MSVFRLSLVAAFLPLAAWAQDSNIPTAATNCVSCHSADGNPLVAGVPILAGQRSDYLQSALRAYRDGHRTGGRADVMRTYALELTDKDIEEIAKWFETN